jgi:hypothetical protein
MHVCSRCIDFASFYASSIVLYFQISQQLNFCLYRQSSGTPTSIYMLKNINLPTINYNIKLNLY